MYVHEAVFSVTKFGTCDLSNKIIDVQIRKLCEPIFERSHPEAANHMNSAYHIN